MKRNHIQGILPPQYQRLLGAKTGLINSIAYDLPSRSDPKSFTTHSFLTNINEFAGAHSGSEDEATGKGFNIEESIIGAVGEAVERYSLCWPAPEEHLLKSSYENIHKQKEVVSFEYLDIYADTEQSSFDPPTRDTPILWAKGTNLINGKRIFVPAQLVWTSSHRVNDMPLRFYTTTNGVATGPSVVSALLTAIYESVERDAFMTMWCRQETPSQINLSRFPEIKQKVNTVLDNDFMDLSLLWLDSMVGFPSVVGTLVNKRDSFPKFAVGAATNLDLSEAVIDAFAEVAQVYPHMRDIPNNEIEDASMDEYIEDLKDNWIIYAKPKHFNKVEFLLEGEQIWIDHSVKSPQNELRACLERLKNSGCTPIAFDLTTEDIRSTGLHVFRVFIPELLPLSPPSLLPRNHPKIANEKVTSRPHPFP